jgi:hypothetical protein
MEVRIVLDDAAVVPLRLHYCGKRRNKPMPFGHASDAHEASRNDEDVRCLHLPLAIAMARVVECEGTGRT